MAALKVIRASAGSGKTFRLTGEFLGLLFTDTDYFMHILAVTFTNKATEDMKSRIIRELYLLSSDKDSNQLNVLMEATGLGENSIRNRAGSILKKMLHNYSRFSISTIDSFFQRIIRSFTHELGIQSGYTIELDIDTIIGGLIDRLLANLENNESLLEWLTRYAESLIEQGEYWNFRDSLIKLGKEVFKEEFSQLLDTSMNQFSNRSLIGKYQTELCATIEKYKKEYKEYGQQAVELMQSFGLQQDDFSNKDKGPAGFLVKLASGEFKEPTPTAIEAALQIEKWYTKTSYKKEIITKACNAGLLDIMQKAIAFYEQKKKDYHTAEVILKNLFTLGILSDLIQIVSLYCNENNVFLLPEAAIFLHRIIRDNDTPFIYEKTGYWYHHFMIDEFQDTSLMQWKNFKPLISNSLSQNFDNLVVGDVKQSIYRWRNSNWEILAEGIKNDFPEENTGFFTLQGNWRSGQEIIDFNNAFFMSASSVLQGIYNEITAVPEIPKDESIKSSIINIYADVMQKSSNTDATEGYVQIDFIRKEGKNDSEHVVFDKLIKHLCDLQDKGYQLSQIAVITRKNSEAEKLADFLLKYKNEHRDSPYKFDVISDDALRLGSSSAISFLIALLYYITKPEDLINKYHIITEYNNYFRDIGHDLNYIIPENTQEVTHANFEQFMPDDFLSVAGSSGKISLAETIEQLIILFKLDRFEGELAYIQAFQDMVLEFSRKNSSDIIRFLEFWNETGIKKSVTAPAVQNAIRILTIHKSKGLEFDIVILPYCNWDLDAGRNTILWCGMEHLNNPGFRVLPVYYSSRLRDTYFDHAYFTELRRQYVDNLNLLYVSFTRARKGLFAFCNSEKKDRLTNVSDLIGAVLRHSESMHPSGTNMLELHKFFDSSAGVFSYGKMPECISKDKLEKETMMNLKYDQVEHINSLSERLRIAFQGNLYLDVTTDHFIQPVNRGKIMHEIFSGIHHIDDVAQSIRRIYLQGKIDIRTRDMIIKQTNELMKDMKVKSWFTGNWKVLSEAEMILPEGQIKRPDRVLVNENQAIVVDFKFGKYTDVHDVIQVKDYVSIIKNMGYEQVEGYLWYVEIGQIQQVA